MATNSVQAKEIGSFNWTTTSLGHPSTWSPTLKSMVQLLLASKQPMFVAWGPDRTFIYNDGYIPIMGRKHPTQLGLPSAEVWSEAWPLTGYAENAVFNHGHLERGMHMLGKPFQMDAFATKVADLLNRAET